MKKTTLVHSYVAKHWYNFTERVALAILFRRPNGVDLKKDIPYGAKKHETFDFMRPKNDGKKLPLLIYVHGGGWISGVKNMRRTYLYEYARKGVAVANVDYDYTPKITWREQLQQVLSAVDFLYDNAHRFNFDKSRVAVAGESAGVYFGMMLCVLSEHSELLDELGVVFRHHAEFKSKVNVFNCGACDLKALSTSKFPDMKLMVECFAGVPAKEIAVGKHDEFVKKLSPVHLLDNGFPPTFILYGERDKLQSESFALKEKLDAAGVENVLYKCSGLLYGNHAFAVSTVTKTGKNILSDTQKFFFKYLVRR